MSLSEVNKYIENMGIDINLFWRVSKDEKLNILFHRIPKTVINKKTYIDGQTFSKLITFLQKIRL